MNFLHWKKNGISWASLHRKSEGTCQDNWRKLHSIGQNFLMWRKLYRKFCPILHISWYRKHHFCSSVDLWYIALWGMQDITHNIHILQWFLWDNIYDMTQNVLLQQHSLFLEKPSCPHATLASTLPQKSSHTVPHAPLLHTSTRPWLA